MHHFPEGAIADDSVISEKALHVLTCEVAGGPLSLLLVSEWSDRAIDETVSERLEQAELASPQFRNVRRAPCEMGGVLGVSFGWEFFDERGGRMAAHQLIAQHGARVVSISATFPSGKGEAGVEAMTGLASAIRWRAA